MWPVHTTLPDSSLSKLYNSFDDHANARIDLRSMLLYKLGNVALSGSFHQLSETQN